MLKPMLASPVDFDLLKYPCYVSPKIDGIRCLIVDGKAMSRSLKLLPNLYLQSLSKDILHGLDLEITVGEPNLPNVMQTTTSGVMSIEGEPDFQLHSLDIWNMPGVSFINRFSILTALSSIKAVRQIICYDRHEVEQELEKYLAAGYEGAMIRNPNATYKFGRSTAREGALLKYKKFADDEAEVIDFVELMHNDNPAFEGELGQTKRQMLQRYMVGMGTLGSLRVKSTLWNQPFNIGTGFDAATRQKIWDNRKIYLGKQVKYKFFEIGTLFAPRFPVFLGWRNSIDRS